MNLFLSGYETSKKASCTTVSGEKSNKTCIFPFIYNGITFNSCTLSWSHDHTKAWCSTRVDESGKHISGHYGFCEPACQPIKVPKDSSTILIVIISITILILLSIIMISYCYVKRNRRKEENVVVDESGPLEINSKYSYSLTCLMFEVVFDNKCFEVL